METILKLENITKTFPGVRALDKVRLDVRRGEVHALLGENGAGKSTLMKIVLGMYVPDGGTMEFDGRTGFFKSPHEALNNGISMIHQEINLVPTLDVAENIWQGREKLFTKAGLISYKERYKATQELLDRLGLNINPKTKVARLSIAQMQMVEIARAVSYNSKIIIMDEPTSALTDAEVEILFRIIKEQQAQGVAIIYISHKMDEILQISDRASVFRDGQYIATVDCATAKESELINMIAGREMSEMFPKTPAEIKGTVLEVRNLTGKGFKNVSFQVHAGEILGFCGLMGAGRTEIMRAIFAIDKHQSGEIYMEGKKVNFKIPKDAVKAGIGMVTEDRLRAGCIHKLSVRYNMTSACLRKYSRFFIKPKKEKEDCATQIKNMNIALHSTEQLISTLSGGNQQKCIIGKWLMTSPKVLILDEPTRGIDVGAKAEIHKLLCKLAQQGIAIILISSEMAEVVGMSDRLFVVHDGELVYECDRANFPSQEVLMAHAFGVADAD